MDIQKLQISQAKIDINLQFYFFLKYSVKLKPSEAQLGQMFEILNSSALNTISGKKLPLENIFMAKNPDTFNAKAEIIKEILLKCDMLIDLELLSIALRLYQIKDLLLQEAKIIKNIKLEKLKILHPLSLEYDALSILKPYSTRVNGALLSLLFFEKLSKNETNFMCSSSHDFLETLANDIQKFKEHDLEPNQVFMLMFSEVINQSIISDSGSNYEQRIFSVLSNIGIKNITKQHDKNDKSTEFDFFFELNGKTYGIGAKRTLRERYKQFIKTALTSKIDITIEITLGLDLNYEKAKTITSHNTYLFVSDEIYQGQKFLTEMDKVFSVKDLNLECLKSLQ
jgi:hypothetical protein